MMGGRNERRSNNSTQQITLEYAIDPRPRWGYDRPSHPELEALIDRGRASYAARLESFLPFVDELADIPFDAVDDHGPSWANGWFQGLDAVALYAFVAQRRPTTYVEVGAGHSTRFARRAVENHRLTTKIVSIDPTPRASLDGVADEHVEARLEDADLSLFTRLAASDIVVIDGSHQSYTNSDATVFFTEVLPRLPTGVLVYVDDVFLPWDYPPQLSDRWYSEQYLLAAWLLAGSRLEITLPDFWICNQPELHRVLAPLWDRFTWAAIPTNGTGFWMTTRAATI
jgi:hypothetical protein